MKTKPGWYYDELKQTGLNFEDAEQVAAYDRNQGSDLAAEQALIKRLGIENKHVVMDIGGGTGAFTLQAARHCHHVHLLDVSQAMLAYAQQKAEAADLNNISFHHAGFLTHEQPSASIDFVITKYALHHLPDFWKLVALQRIAEVLKPGGILYLRDVIFSFPPKDYANAIDGWISRVAQAPGEGFTASDFEMHVRDEYSTFSWIMESLLKQAGFEIVEQAYFTPEHAEYVCKKSMQ